MRPRLLILTSSFPRWPHDFAANFVAEFAQSLANDFQITILSPPSANCANHEVWQNITIKRFNYLWPHRAQKFDAAIDLQTIIEQHRLAIWQIIPFMIVFCWRAFLLAREADIICSHWLVPAGLIGSLIKLITGKPHINIEHSGALHLLRRIVGGRQLLSIIRRGSNRLIVVSEQLKREMLLLCPASAAQLTVLAMGINYQQFAQAALPHNDCDCNQFNITRDAADNYVVLYLGRLTPIKGVSVLLQALADCHNITLLIAGEGEQRSYLQQYAQQLNVNARFLGAVTGKRKAQLLACADLVVLPSLILSNGRSEGTPVVCLEAFAAARAVIASAVGGLNELVIDNQSGMLAAPGDASQLRSKIVSLLADQPLRQQLATRAQQIALQHDWSIVANRVKEILCQSM